MQEKIQNYAKQLKLREQIQEVKASTHEEFLLRLFEAEIHQREECRIHRLLTHATLPKVQEKLYDWSERESPCRNEQGGSLKWRIY